MAHRSGPTNRDLFPGSGAGKGDADRSPKWRDHWERPIDKCRDGFTQVRAGRWRKVYR